MATAGVKRAVGTSGDAVTRGRRPSAADLARCRADCLTGAMLPSASWQTKFQELAPEGR